MDGRVGRHGLRSPADAVHSPAGLRRDTMTGRLPPPPGQPGGDGGRRAQCLCLWMGWSGEAAWIPFMAGLVYELIYADRDLEDDDAGVLVRGAREGSVA